MATTSFLTWFISLVTGVQMQQLLVYLIVGVFGIVAHYYKKYVAEEVAEGLWRYLYLDHPRNTILTLVSFAGTAVAYVFSSAAASISWPSFILLAFTTGFSFDSAINKGSV